MNRRLWISVFITLFAIPFVSLRNLNSIRFVSFIALICFAWVIVVILSFAYDSNIDPCQGIPQNQCIGHIDDYPTDITGFLGIFCRFFF